jgi:hypothetical protein
VGYRDYSYTTSASAPTAQEGQSKVWYAGGSWWGALYHPVSRGFYIYKLDQASQTWNATSTQIDTRGGTIKIDAFWDAGSGKLNIVSASNNPTSGLVQYRRFSFSGGSYSLDVGPITLSSTAAEGGIVTIDRDGAGVLWASYVPVSGDLRPYVTRSGDGGGSWITPYAIPGAQTVDEEDLSAVVRFGSQIGVMYGDHASGTYYFARHAAGAPDSAWIIETAYSRPEGSDNHISVKSDSSGRVYAAVKTSLNKKNDPLLVLLVRATNGQWSNYTFSTVAAQQTRPTVVVNEANGRLYYFASSDPNYIVGKIYYKSTSLSSISFAAGSGTLIIDSSLDTKINNVSSTKQVITGGMGILVIAGDDSTRRYLHNWLP